MRTISDDLLESERGVERLDCSLIFCCSETNGRIRHAPRSAVQQFELQTQACWSYTYYTHPGRTEGSIFLCPELAPATASERLSTFLIARLSRTSNFFPDATPEWSSFKLESSFLASASGCLWQPRTGPVRHLANPCVQTRWTVYARSA